MRPERMQLIEELIEVGRDAVSRGLVLASGGNLSARLSDDRFVITASGTWFDRLTPEDFSEVDLAGVVISGAHRPSSEWRLHQRAYVARPDAECVIHLHPQHAVVLASLGRPIRLLTLDHALYVGSVGVTPFFPNGSDELADSAATELRTHDCVIMQHHGCSVVGDTVRATYRRALNLEDAAKATALALQLGDTATSFPTGADTSHA
ncbi:class II aldolase/adducin family protein [Leucobacter sp. W1153]|uniref:class II aldolase/adducin family protein n=1 Tax=Leucobacter sp. W1153 TaxID=3439064 RepID=UPI003F2AE307